MTTLFNIYSKPVLPNGSVEPLAKYYIQSQDDCRLSVIEIYPTIVELIKCHDSLCVAFCLMMENSEVTSKLSDKIRSIDDELKSYGSFRFRKYYNILGMCPENEIL